MKGRGRVQSDCDGHGSDECWNANKSADPKSGPQRMLHRAELLVHDVIKLSTIRDGYSHSLVCHGAYCVKTKSCSFAWAAWHAKQASCCASSTGLPLMNRPNPQPPVEAYLLESLTMNWTVVACPGTKAWNWPRAPLSSADGTCFQATLARIVPSGN